MSLTGSYALIISASGITIQSNVTRLASQGIEPVDVDLPAGKAGTLTTRTNNTDGAATLSAGHGILTADVVDIYWDGGCRYGAIVGTVAGNVVPFGSGSGDNLVLIGASASQRSHLTFVDAGGATLHPVAIDPGEAWAWVSDTGVDNPLSGNAVASIKASNGSSTNSSNLKLTGLQYAA